MLVAAAPELLKQWRQNFRLNSRVAPRVWMALEQMLLPRPPEVLNPRAGATEGNSEAELERWWEQVHYTAPRLAKLGLALGQVTKAMAQFRPLAVERLRARFDATTALALQDWFQQQASLALAEAYVEQQSRALSALVAVLDAELGAADLKQLLERLLRQAAQLFPAHWGEILLLEESAPGKRRRLRHAAIFGLRPGLIREAAGVGTFFADVLHRGAPGFIRDARGNRRLAQPYYGELGVKSVWAAPLVGSGPRQEPLGVLTLAFDRVYECLPRERELLRVLAERSSLAIERTRMAHRLARERSRAAELSRRLLQAQDEERRRLSRELHDETGQSLLALRVYLEMGLRAMAGTEAMGARRWLRKGVSLVDASVAELRRILARLSPLMLDELGLEAALRLELRQLRAQHGWRTRFDFATGGRPLGASLEVLAYRVVMEGLRNVARHARARNVRLRIAAGREELRIRLRDDGVGLGARRPRRRAQHFGLAGMRERVRLAGGRLALESAPGHGLALAIAIPLEPAPQPPANEL